MSDSTPATDRPAATNSADPQRPVRIVVADDQASVREGLSIMLGLLPDIDVVGAEANGQEALDVVAATQPDAILLDLNMPVLDGTETTRRLRALHPQVAVIILTTYADDSSVITALQAGARSYLTKDADRADIAQALRSAATGLSVLDPTVHATLLAAAAAQQSRSLRLPENLPDGLTQREAEILAMIGRGMTNPDIAAELFLSTHTIKSRINRVFAKTGSADRTAAIRYAREHGLA